MIWWWQSGCKKRCLPDSITELGLFVKIKLIQDDDWAYKWVGSEIICSKPCTVIRASIFVPCKVAMPSDHHAGDLALSSPKMM